MEMFSQTEKNNIFTFFKKINKDTEFEVMFNNYKSDNQLELINFMNVMKYLKLKSKQEKLKLKESIMLDIIYKDNTNNRYRGTIEGQENINNFLNLVHNRQNNIIFSIFVSQFLDKEGNYLIQKIRGKNDVMDFDDYNIRFRMSKEVKVEDRIIKNFSKLSYSQAENILFRYKQRLSLELEEDLNIDITIVKTSTDVNKIVSGDKTFELEIDYSKNNTNAETFKRIIKEVEMIKKVMISSNIILTKKEEDDIIIKYKNIVFGSNNLNFNNLYSMHPISAEVQHIIDYIPNKYSVTDKADGDKYSLFIVNNSLYLLSNNLGVKKLNTTVKNLNNTILEGEYIYLEKERKYIFMMFDCLYYKDKDVRNESDISKRMNYVIKAVNELSNNPYFIKEYKGDYSSNNSIKSHYNKEISNFYDNLNKNIKNLKVNDTLFSQKVFIYPSGANNSEAFLYAELIWNSCNYDSKINCPYMLDGIIFTPLNQKYTNEVKEQKLPIYKYKPPSINSIDVYVQFEKNVETGGNLYIFDNSLPDTIEYSSYQVLNIFVGENIGGKEKPVPFITDEDNQIFIPVIDGQARDMKGNIIQDNSVIEIVYNGDSNLPHKYSWSILRTRWDKTESVMKHQKKYGNYKTVAEKVWKSIREAVTINEISNLANPKTYNTQMNLLKSKLNSSVITSQRQQDKYYQKITNLIKKMREFHNWIKSIIIYTYASPMAESIGGKEKRQSFLDIGCGRGGDILKVYHARVGDYVGVDVDYEGIYSATDGAISRFNYLKKKFPDFGKVTFLQADGGVKFNSTDQGKALLSISSENKNSIEKVFTKDKEFDVFNSQFAIHYLFSNDTKISNLVDNIKTFLKNDGYILMTLFDADIVHNYVKDSGKYTATYTDEEGNRNKLFEIVKKYNGDIKDKSGQAVDVHMSWISEEGKYIEEYLVTKNFMIETMKRAGCRLVDTDLFKNIYTMNKPYFENVIEYEENPKNKQFYEKVASFYDNLKGADKESKNWSFLYRYYIFQKI
jgi:SAM-dependent methyltransferase